MMGPESISGTLESEAMARVRILYRVSFQEAEILLLVLKNGDKLSTRGLCRTVFCGTAPDLGRKVLMYVLLTVLGQERWWISYFYGGTRWTLIVMWSR